MEKGFLASNSKDNDKEGGGGVESPAVTGLGKQVKNIEGKMLGRDGKPLKSVYNRRAQVGTTQSADDKLNDFNVEQPKAGNTVHVNTAINMDKNSGVSVTPQEGIENMTKSQEDKATHCTPGSHTKSSTSFVDALNAAGNLGNGNASSLGSDPSKLVRFRQLVNRTGVENADCVLTKSVAAVVKSKYDNTLVGYFLGKNIAFQLVKNYVYNTWGKFGLLNLTKNDDGIFLFKFASKEGLEQVLQRGPWMIRNSPILLSKWSPSLSLKKGEVNKVPVWVKLYNVPVLAYSGDGLSLIATKVGKPIMLDAFTSSMCVDSWGRISFARALIEVCADSVLKKEVIMAIENEEGDEYTREVIRVEYEWQPPHCVTCKCFGHDPNSCPKREKVDVFKAPPKPTTSSSAVDKEDGFVVVTSRKKKKKPVPNHVSGINLSKCNPSLKYRPVSQPGKGKGKASNEDNGPKKGSGNDNGSDNPSHVDEIVPTKNSFANLMVEDSALTQGLNERSFVTADGKKDGTSAVKVAAKSLEQGSLWEKFKANKEGSSSNPKFTSLEDETDDDDDEVYMPNSHGGAFMDGLEDDLECYDGYGTRVYDLTPQDQAFCDQYDIRL